MIIIFKTTKGAKKMSIAAVFGRIIYWGLFAFAGYILYFNFVQMKQFIFKQTGRTDIEYFETTNLTGPHKYIIEFTASHSDSYKAKMKGEMFLHIDQQKVREKSFKKKSSGDDMGTPEVSETLKYVLTVPEGVEREIVVEGRTKKDVSWSHRIIKDPPDNYEIFERLKFGMIIIAFIALIVVEGFLVRL